MNPSLEKIFEKAYADNIDGLFRFVLYKVSDKEQAIDIVEDVYLRFWQTLQKEKVEEIRAYLYKIARNLVIDWYKKKKSIPLQSFKGEESENSELYLDMFTGNLVGIDVMLEVKIVIEKIASLEPIYREAVYLRFVEEMTPKEIAAVLGESTNVISVRINRGLNLLKLKLHI
ncbi:MAG: sigma-70 family RNA polymerase sigma factor [Candidatus Paceibacterota bacterium]|jgi:RNA polymerase sigma-70 factor (ECF subfamily)